MIRNKRQLVSTLSLIYYWNGLLTTINRTSAEWVQENSIDTGFSAENARVIGAGKEIIIRIFE